MIEILNPVLTLFDNLIPVFQAGEDSTPIPFAILRARHVIAWALTTAVVLAQR